MGDRVKRVRLLFFSQMKVAIAAAPWRDRLAPTAPIGPGVAKKLSLRALFA
jgi:hypothetical protein